MMADTVSKVFTSLSYFLLCSALLLNTAATYILSKLDSRASKHNLLLINLTIIKITITFSELTLIILETLKIDEEYKSYQMVDVFNSGLYGVNDLVILVITLDRLLASAFTIHYNSRVTRNRLIIAVVGSWLTGTAGILPFFFIAYDYLYNVYYKIVFLSLDALVLTITIVTYGYILKQLCSRKRVLHGQSNQDSSFLRQHGQFFYITSLIIASYILFVAIPDTVYVIMSVINENSNPLIEQSIGLVWNIYLITDPFIYIFLQKRVRRRFTNFIMRTRVEPSTEVTMASRYKADNVGSRMRHQVR